MSLAALAQPASGATDFSLPEADARLLGVARGWLWLGLLALIGSGAFPLVIEKLKENEGG